MKITTLLNKIKNLPKKITVPMAAAILLTLPVVALAGFGPERPTYDYTKVCNPNDGDKYDRCGSLEGPVFNSFVNTPTYGDERNFTRVAEVVAGQSPVEADFGETKNAQAGKEYWVRTFVHNNANQTTNDTNGVAKDTKVRVAIAQGVSNGVDVMSYVSASNATPATVWDSATLANQSRAFSVQYVPGSAKIYNPAHQNGLALPDAIVSANGTPVGYDQMNGNLPGCFEFSAYVYVKVKVAAPDLTLDKLVRKQGENSSQWRDRVVARKGERVQYLIEFKNTGSTVANNIVLRDQLPNNVELVPGTVEWVDNNRPNGTPVRDDLLFAPAGVTVGNYGVNGVGQIYFDAIVKNGDLTDCEARNVAFARATNVPEQNDDAVVVIEDCNPPQPVVSCDALTAVALGSRSFRYELDYTAQDAELKTVRYDFGDDTTPLVTDKTTAEHQYAADGTYVTRATITFMVDGEERVVTGNNCLVTVSAETPKDNCIVPGKEHQPKDSPECKEAPVTPVTATALPDTGPGDVAAIFAAVSLGATMAYRFVLTRRNG